MLLVGWGDELDGVMSGIFTQHLLVKQQDSKPHAACILQKCNTKLPAPYVQLCLLLCCTLQQRWSRDLFGRVCRQQAGAAEV